MSQIFRLPADAPHWVRELTRTLEADLVRKEPVILGLNVNDDNIQIRFRARLTTSFVLVHAQSDEEGEGGVTEYDPDNFAHQEERDTRDGFIQDFTLPDPHASIGKKLVFLVPVEYDRQGGRFLLDGLDGRPDAKTFWGLEVK